MIKKYRTPMMEIHFFAYADVITGSIEDETPFVPFGKENETPFVPLGDAGTDDSSSVC